MNSAAFDGDRNENCKPPQRIIEGDDVVAAVAKYNHGFVQRDAPQFASALAPVAYAFRAPARSP
jgi:hypothetical protein